MRFRKLMVSLVTGTLLSAGAVCFATDNFFLGDEKDSKLFSPKDENDSFFSSQADVFESDPKSMSSLQGTWSSGDEKLKVNLSFFIRKFQLQGSNGSTLTGTFTASENELMLMLDDGGTEKIKYSLEGDFLRFADGSVFRRQQPGGLEQKKAEQVVLDHDNDPWSEDGNLTISISDTADGTAGVEVAADNKKEKPAAPVEEYHAIPQENRELLAVDYDTGSKTPEKSSLNPDEKVAESPEADKISSAVKTESENLENEKTAVAMEVNDSKKVKGKENTATAPTVSQADSKRPVTEEKVPADTNKTLTSVTSAPAESLSEESPVSSQTHGLEGVWNCRVHQMLITFSFSKDKYECSVNGSLVESGQYSFDEKTGVFKYRITSGNLEGLEGKNKVEFDGVKMLIIYPDRMQLPFIREKRR